VMNFFFGHEITRKTVSISVRIISEKGSFESSVDVRDIVLGAFCVYFSRQK